MLAVVTNLPGWRVASPESDLEKAPDADWPLYPTTLPVLPVMFGRPNISGRFEYHAWAAQRTGAFYEGTSGVLKTGGNTDRGSGDARTLMDASLVNSAYGNSSTVQPSSLLLVLCIKS